MVEARVARALHLVVAATVVAAVLSPDISRGRAGSAGGATTAGPSRGRRPAIVDRRFVIGRSVRGRPIRAAELGNPSSPRRLLVVGCIHGDECAGIRIAKALAREPAPTRACVWIVFDLNPDGHALGTRQNARGVDLNRNFPYRWRPIGTPGSRHYSGPRPASEPETRRAIAFVRRIHPSIGIWFHQPLGLVDLSGGNPRVEKAYARSIGLPAVRLPRYPGSGVRWENHVLRTGTAFATELPYGPLTARKTERYADSALALLSRWWAPG